MAKKTPQQILDDARAKAVTKTRRQELERRSQELERLSQELEDLLETLICGYGENFDRFLNQSQRDNLEYLTGRISELSE